jgi:hypothetical protein
MEKLIFTLAKKFIVQLESALARIQYKIYATLIYYAG